MLTYNRRRAEPIRPAGLDALPPAPEPLIGDCTMPSSTVLAGMNQAARDHWAAVRPGCAPLPPVTCPLPDQRFADAAALAAWNAAQRALGCEEIACAVPSPAPATADAVAAWNNAHPYCPAVAAPACPVPDHRFADAAELDAWNTAQRGRGCDAQLCEVPSPRPATADDIAAWNAAHPYCPAMTPPAADGCAYPESAGPVLRSKVATWNADHPDCPPWAPQIAASGDDGRVIDTSHDPPAQPSSGVPAWVWWAGGLAGVGWLLANAKKRRSRGR